MIKKLKEIKIFKYDKIHNALIKINNNGYNGVFVIDKKQYSWHNNRLRN